MSVQPTIIRDLAGLIAVEEAWWELWRRCPAATPFATPAWCLSWWEAFGPGRLQSVALHDDDGRLVALAPLYLEEGAGWTRLLPIGIGITDYLDVLVDPAGGPEIGRRLAEAVASGVPDWQVWELEELQIGRAHV